MKINIKNVICLIIVILCLSNISTRSTNKIKMNSKNTLKAESKACSSNNCPISDSAPSLNNPFSNKSNGGSVKSSSQSSSYSSSYNSSSNSAVFNAEQVCGLAKSVANAIFSKDKSKTISDCFTQIHDNQEAAKTQLMAFFQECKKISGDPKSNWNNDIFDKTIMEFLKKYSVPELPNMTCAAILHPYEKNADFANLPKYFSKIFDNSGKVSNSSTTKERFLFGANQNLRGMDKLPAQYFETINSESRRPARVPGI
jgi:hypothetical protein